MKKWIFAAAIVTLCGTMACNSQKRTRSAQTVTTSTELLSGNWNIITVDGKKIISEEPAFLAFDIKEKRIHGNNGCNIINGQLMVENDGTFRLDKVISTMRACAGDNPEPQIMKALNDTRSFKIESKNNLKLYNADRKEVLSLKKQPFSELDGTWDVTLINGKSLTDNQKPFITFDTKERRISGNAGCNRMNGQITTDNANEYYIVFGQVATTRMACPGTTEPTMLAALENVKSFKILPEKNGKQTAELCDAQGKAIITLEKKK
ncbi:META domain-containing protein [Coprobacter sp.]